MHIQTHVMSGWCVGNCFTLTPRERLLSMLAASLPDLDGLGFFLGGNQYWEYHHKLCHNLIFGLLLSGGLAVFASHRVKSFLIFLGLFHLHLVLDYFGSGPGWDILYLWPFSAWSLENPHAWPFYSWQNISTGIGCLVWVIIIARCQRRTPLEVLMPSLDRQLVERLAITSASKCPRLGA